MEQLDLEEPTLGSFIVPDIQVQKHSLTSSWSTYVDLPGKLFWSDQVLVCMLLFFLKTLCMVAFFLALFFLRKRSFSWLIECLLCRTKIFFLMKSVGVRIGKLSTIYNLGSEKVYSKHVVWLYRLLKMVCMLMTCLANVHWTFYIDNHAILH